jgi:hypothetical protein
MRLSRRPLFFLVVTVTCLLLFEPTPASFRWVNLSMAALSFFWFVLLAAEELLAQRGKDGPPSEGDHP